MIDASGGRIRQGENLFDELCISTDTRTIKNTDIFLPLSGENFDGHNFIDNAIDKRCRGYFTEKDSALFKAADFIISVDNTLEAYLKIARYARRKINPKVVAITGSLGKTSVKEFVYEVLSTSFKTHKSFLNHNNEVGLCQTLLSMPESTQYAAIEMGMRGLGEIEILSRYSEPDIAVINNIGMAHIGKLGSIDKIAEAKCEITSYLKESGLLIAFDDELIKKSCNWHREKLFYGRNYKLTSQEENLTGFIYKDEYFEIPVMGEYNVINSIAAIEVGRYSGISYENIRKGLLNYAPVGDRGKIINLNNGAKLVVDCYNANPDSVIASINNIIEVCKNSPIILVLGDMEELGEYEKEFHRKVGKFISDTPVKSLVTVGEKAKLIAEAVENKKINVNSFLNNAETAKFLLNSRVEEPVILFKASRNMKLEEIAKTLQNSSS